MKKVLILLTLILIVTTASVVFWRFENKKPAKEQVSSQNVKEKAVAQIANSQLAVDADGNVIPKTTNGLTQLFFAQEASPQAGQKLEDSTSTFTIKLISLLKKSDFHTTSVRIIAPDNILAYDQQQTIAVFSSQKDANLQVDTLQQVLAEARIGDNKIAKIDLRYNNPIISNK